MITITIRNPGIRRTAKPVIIRARTTGDSVKPADPYEDLARRLHAALIEAIEEAEGSTHDEKEGHAFRGNQYVTVAGQGGEELGPKPTSAKAEGTKHKLHKLLSSGHAFTKKELLDIMGEGHLEVTVSTWLSKFKSEKFAGSFGALNIKKLPNGAYQVVKGDGAPAGPNPTPPSPLPTPEPAKEVGAKLKNKTEADKNYHQTIKKSIVIMQNNCTTAQVEGDLKMAEASVLKFKQQRAEALADWANHVHGHDVKAKKQELFEADKILAKTVFDLADTAPAGQHFEGEVDKAVAHWKHNTALEKQGKLGKDKPIPAGATNAVMASFHSDAPLPAPVAYDALVPKTFKPIGPDDLTQAKGLQTGMASLKSKLAGIGTGNELGNKVLVQSELTKRLADKPHFQALKKAVKLGMKNTLESRLIQVWAGSSGDTQPIACSLQLAVRDAFSLPGQHLETKSLQSLSQGEENCLREGASKLGLNIKSSAELATFKAGLQEFVQAQYSATQDMFKDQGIDHVYVARGMRYAVDPDDNQKQVNLKLQPASSFSASFSTAKGFARSGTVFLAKVPASQVLSTYVTGFGCTKEDEVVVLAHESIKSYAVKTSPTKGGLEEIIEGIRNKNGIKKGATI